MIVKNRSVAELWTQLLLSSYEVNTRMTALYSKDVGTVNAAAFFVCSLMYVTKNFSYSQIQCNTKSVTTIAVSSFDNLGNFPVLYQWLGRINEEYKLNTEHWVYKQNYCSLLQVFFNFNTENYFYE